MIGFFKNKSNELKTGSNFDYLDKDQYYFDSTCQTLRPQQVIDAEVKYYQTHNSCGHRVKYKWGEKTDKIIEECRSNILKMVKKTEKDYVVAFTLNTTFGINQVLFQLPQKYKNIYISDIEHNSVFIPSIKFKEMRNGNREILDRKDNGSLELPKRLNTDPVLLVNTTSNIDGRHLENAPELAEIVHKNNGLILLDACQSFTHNLKLLQDTDFDACFGSGHKMYGPSIGFIILKKELANSLDSFWLGGSTVQKVSKNSFELIEDQKELYTRLEAGLQNYAGIVGLNEAVKWLNGYSKIRIKEFKESKAYQTIKDLDEYREILTKSDNYEDMLGCYLDYKLTKIDNITLLNNNPSPIVSFYSKKVDSHKLGSILGEFNIMGRSGYHCCHYYLIEKMNLPSLYRLSIGLNNTPEQIDFVTQKLESIVKSLG